MDDRREQALFPELIQDENVGYSRSWPDDVRSRPVSDELSASLPKGRAALTQSNLTVASV